MTVRILAIGFGFLFANACRGGAQRGTTPPDGSASSSGETSACAPQKLGLSGAKLLTNWQAPAGCQGPTGGSTTEVVIRSEADFKLNFRCTPEAPSGVDFGVNELVVSARMLSPAGTGTSVFDDGSTTTVVSLSRDPCANSPLPMPMGYTLAFLLPANAERTFTEKTCTLERQCD